MDAEGTLNRRAVIVGLVALGLGLVIGLVVLGWWLFPVQWSEFSPEQMGPADQEEWLRMAIDSMVYHYDIVAARTRYEYLGEDGPAILATIQANPAPQSQQSVQAFSELVQAERPPEAVPPTSAMRPFIILLLALAVLGLVGWIVYRLIRRQSTAAEALPPADFPAEGVQPEQAFDVEAVVLAEEGADRLAEPAAEEFPPEGTVDEKVTGEESPEATLETGGMGATAAGAIAAMAAAGLDEEPEEALAEVSEGQGEETAVAGIAAAEAALSEEQGEADEALQAPSPEAAETATPAPLPAEETLEAGVAAEPPRMPTDLVYVEGIGPIYAEKLKEIGVNTPEQLLNWGATPRGRQAIAERSGISPKLLLTWINHIDLYRIRGVGSEYAELLEAAGVDTVLELAARNPAHLYQALVAVNEAKNLVRKLPVQSQVDDWVRQAKGLPRVVSY